MLRRRGWLGYLTVLVGMQGSAMAWCMQSNAYSSKVAASRYCSVSAAAAPHQHSWICCCAAPQAPDKPTYIEVGFEKGDPVTLDGVALSPAAMLTALNKVAGDNGIGRIDIVESRFVGEQQLMPGDAVEHRSQL
jgi:argininosuccinate synthase